MKEDRIANHVSIRIACHKLLGLIDFEIPKGIHAEIGKHLEGVGALHVQVSHMVRLIEKRAGFPPGTLLISPVGELRLHHGKRVRPDLRIAQQLDGTPRGLYRVFQVSITHSCW
jgi:hypothetical protein